MGQLVKLFCDCLVVSSRNTLADSSIRLLSPSRVNGNITFLVRDDAANRFVCVSVLLSIHLDYSFPCQTWNLIHNRLTRIDGNVIGQLSRNFFEQIHEDGGMTNVYRLRLTLFSG